MRDTPAYRETGLIQDAVTLVARWWPGWLLLIFHALDTVSGGWGHIWREEPWALVDVAQQLGIPSSAITLAVVGGVLLFACLALIIGLFTRMAAFAVIVVLLGALWFLKHDRAAVEVILALLLGPVLAMILGGGGWSLDRMIRIKGPVRR
ncbi:MAG: putative membrane protein YphA (DoxX/SURF4 family) [Verrucomicrobiales bacterium]|jgi:uncharacterized membrane protein YphA (DoxX/SURF4 family)